MKKQDKDKQLINLAIRYVIIFFAGLGNLWIFYKILTPLTIKTVAFFFSLFTKTSISANLIITQGVIIEIIPACVAGSAYYLLLILMLTTPKIEPIKRIKVLILSFISLFILNIIRIIILTLTSNSLYFELTHLIFWYLISTIFVVAIWIAVIKIFKIKQIPVYSDIKFVANLRNKKKPTRKKKVKKTP
ncbi:hypothetical protein CL614_07220 [archaeon]|nr:hypothetical protein [archaeon]|tara:strand:- start:4285 stop:4851 length:567 start_codon:yes stop_codon:yes gene_type:complete